MNKQATIIIAGAGGIAEAAALLLAEWSPVSPTIYIGNRTLSKAQNVAKWVREGVTRDCKVEAFHLPSADLEKDAQTIFEQADILLDCLPGSLAPRMARLAKDHHLHYLNLTEYVSETNEIIELAKDADTAFVLQTGLAPGYIDVLAHGMFQQFCTDYGVDRADRLEFKVGALTDHAVGPHYYGFTWSPVGVATEYLKDAIVLREYKKVLRPALSERGQLIIDGISYEDDLTSGGAADLPDALSGKVRTLDYKTLRHPGHYGWIDSLLNSAPDTADQIAYLQQKMEEAIPHIEDDRIVLYAAVEGPDATGTLRRREVAKTMSPQTVGKHRLRAIQTTTAVPMLQAAQLVWENQQKGVLLQSHIQPGPFLNGNYIVPVYGAV